MSTVPETWSIVLTGDNQAELLPANYLISFGGGRMGGEPEYDPQSLADAALIVAAPKLLAALKKLEDCMCKNSDGEARYQDWLEIARAAIAETHKIPTKNAD